MKRGIQFLSGVIVLCFLVGPTLAWYPSTVQIELGTATW